MSRLLGIGRRVWGVVDRYGWVIALVFLAFVGWRLYHQGADLHKQGVALHNQGVVLRDTQLVETRTNKESIESRIITVEQRCHFNLLVNNEIVLRAPRADLSKFEHAYKGCERQLANVKALNARTPAPPGWNPKR
jgi:hypothetical protein